jgi:hypothetical protein
LAEANLRARTGASVVAIMRGRELITNPGLCYEPTTLWDLWGMGNNSISRKRSWLRLETAAGKYLVSYIPHLFAPTFRH